MWKKVFQLIFSIGKSFFFRKLQCVHLNSIRSPTKILFFSVFLPLLFSLLFFFLSLGIVLFRWFFFSQFRILLFLSFDRSKKEKKFRRPSQPFTNCVCVFFSRSLVSLRSVSCCCVLSARYFLSLHSLVCGTHSQLIIFGERNKAVSTLAQNIIHIFFLSFSLPVIQNQATESTTITKFKWDLIFFFLEIKSDLKWTERNKSNNQLRWFWQAKHWMAKEFYYTNKCQVFELVLTLVYYCNLMSFCPVKTIKNTKKIDKKQEKKKTSKDKPKEKIKSALINAKQFCVFIRFVFFFSGVWYWLRLRVVLQKTREKEKESERAQAWVYVRVWHWRFCFRGKKSMDFIAISSYLMAYNQALLCFFFALCFFGALPIRQKSNEHTIESS